MRSALRRIVASGSRFPRYLLYCEVGGISDRNLDYRFRAAMLANELGVEPLAQIHLRLRVVDAIALVLHDFEPQVVERPAHLVELVFRLDDDLVEALFDRPEFLLFGQRPEMALTPP